MHLPINGQKVGELVLHAYSALHGATDRLARVRREIDLVNSLFGKIAIRVFVGARVWFPSHPNSDGQIPPLAPHEWEELESVFGPWTSGRKK